MRGSFKITISTIASICMVTIGLVSSSGAVNAETTNPPPLPTHHPVIREIPHVDPSVNPPVGQVVTVTSATAVTTYAKVSSACTESVTSNTPYKSNGNAIGEVICQSASTCSLTTTSWSAFLDSEGVFGLMVQRMFSNGQISAGGVSALMPYTCQNSNPTKWRTGGLFGSSGSNTYSNTVTLNC